MYEYLVNIDYLVLYCEIQMRVPNGRIITELEPFGSRSFARIEKILLDGEYIAKMESEPRSTVIRERTCLLKIENRILYHYDCFSKIDTLIKLLNVRIISISRIDICVDLISFENKLKPGDLINGFMKERYLRNGRGKYMIIGSQKNVRDVEYLRFGSRKSPINTYLYNKSLEMEQVKYKEYIAETWQHLSGADKNQVWRLEHSLKGEACTYVREETGEIFRLSYDDLKNPDFIIDLFFTLTHKYFQFKINDNQKNKSRMKNLKLFDFESSGMKRISLTKRSDITRKDKVLMKNLVQFTDTNFEAGDKERNSAENLLDFMKNSPYLERYYHKKIDEWKEEQGKIINKKHFPSKTGDRP